MNRREFFATAAVGLAAGQSFQTDEAALHPTYVAESKGNTNTGNDGKDAFALNEVRFAEVVCVN